LRPSKNCRAIWGIGYVHGKKSLLGGSSNLSPGSSWYAARKRGTKLTNPKDNQGPAYDVFCAQFGKRPGGKNM